MHLVEQTRKSLNFVDDDPGRVGNGGNLLGEEVRIGGKFLKYGFVEQIDAKGIWI